MGQNWWITTRLIEIKKKKLSYLFQGENVGIGWGIGSPMVKLQFN